jgi:hypothetical protein
MKNFAKISYILWALILVTFTSAEAKITDKEANKLIARSSAIEQEGWLLVHIEGKPYARGFQYGYRAAELIAACRDYIALEFEHNSKKTFDVFTGAAERMYADKFDAEAREEMRGVVDGVNYAGKPFAFKDILAINTYFDVSMWWDTIESKKEKEEEKDHCSAFIAVGDMTSNGEIVLAHNTWFEYTFAPFCRIILEIVPDKGHKILMQNWAGMLFSGTDFFLTDAGLIGTETTIGGFKSFDPNGVPVAQRARWAMQYGDGVTDWVERISAGNNGAYANAWLIGDIRTGEIARLELGLKYTSLERTRNGYFTGSNIAENAMILKEETTRDPNDLTHHSTGRRVRWQQLMRQYQGKIDLDAAKIMLADHFDSYLGLDRPGPRSLCGHVELASLPCDCEVGAWGAIDGKVVTSELAKKWSFWGRFGRSCDIGFEAKQFLKDHPKFEWMGNFLGDLHPQPWTLIEYPQNKK